MSAPDRSLRDHYAASQFRTEAWNLLQQSTASLRIAADGGDETAEIEEAVRASLTLLNKVESYWAFPGTAACAELLRLLDQGRLSALATRTSKIVRLLVSHLYRTRDLPESILDDVDAREPDARADTHAPDRPYFEVLIVDDMDAADQEELRRSLKAVQRPDDEFVYEIVVVPTFEDAVIAVLFNDNIQSCVIRYRFPN